jgi:hypothetical protein
MAGIRRGDPVIYNGDVYWVVDGPTMSTRGAIFSISLVPPPIQGVPESELQDCPAGFADAALSELRSRGPGT